MSSPDPYAETLTSLAKFETFDPKAFAGDSEWPQDVCDLVLCLAMVHNDYSDVDFAFGLRNRVMPADSSVVTTEVAFHKGIGIHLGKIMASVVHELLELLRTNAKVLESPAFQRLKKTLPKALKPAWDDLVNSSNARPAQEIRKMLLLMARNKVAFHYDREDIGRSYRELFLEGQSPVPPLVSRGVSARSTRFYFADAIAERSIFRVNEEAANDFFSGNDPILKKINLCLYHLVTSFLMQRRSPWKEARVEDIRLPRFLGET